MKIACLALMLLLEVPRVRARLSFSPFRDDGLNHETTDTELESETARSLWNTFEFPGGFSFPGQGNGVSGGFPGKGPKKKHGHRRVAETVSPFGDGLNHETTDTTDLDTTELESETARSLRNAFDFPGGFSFPGQGNGVSGGFPGKGPKKKNGVGRRRLLVEAAAPTSIAWLMSFPNSGTSFTMHLVRRATNTTVASNYAWEGDQPSIMALDESGPVNVVDNLPTSDPPDGGLIFTKTHCHGYTGYQSKINYIHNPRSFQWGCARRSRFIETEEGSFAIEDQNYDTAIVKKMVHLVRNPFDNIVSRFHNEHSKAEKEGNTEFPAAYPRDKIGFQTWCKEMDKDRSLFKTWPVSVDAALKDSLRNVPCYSEFFKFVQWHNLAFSVARDMDVPELVIHYEAYGGDVVGQLNTILDFLDMRRRTNEIWPFKNKSYSDYYTKNQKENIVGFIQEYASAPTWKGLAYYNLHKVFDEDPKSEF